MAKKSKIVRNEQRKAPWPRYAPLRAELKETIRGPRPLPKKRVTAQFRLAGLPRDASPYDCAIETPRMDVRAVTCESSAFPRSGTRDGTPRELPGVHKSSW